MVETKFPLLPALWAGNNGNLVPFRRYPDAASQLDISSAPPEMRKWMWRELAIQVLPQHSAKLHGGFHWCHTVNYRRRRRRRRRQQHLNEAITCLVGTSNFTSGSFSESLNQIHTVTQCSTLRQLVRFIQGMDRKRKGTTIVQLDSDK